MKYILLLLIAFNLYADHPLTRDERIVALTILGEARGEGERGMKAVACVIQQRASERNLTPAKVCLEPWQFSVWNAGGGKVKKERELYNLWKSPSMMYARELARNMCRGKKLNTAFTGYANHYHSIHIKKKPDWTRCKKPVRVIGNHVFYRL